MNTKTESRWYDKCTDCVHTLKGTCPISRAISIYQATCAMGTTCCEKSCRDILEQLAPFYGPCKLFWPRVRSIK